MGTVIAIAASSFAAGVVFGLIIGPSTERETSAYIEGFVKGVDHSKETPQ